MGEGEQYVLYLTLKQEWKEPLEATTLEKEGNCFV